MQIQEENLLTGGRFGQTEPLFRQAVIMVEGRASAGLAICNPCGCVNYVLFINLLPLFLGMKNCRPACGGSAAFLPAPGQQSALPAAVSAARCTGRLQDHRSHQMEKK